MKRAQARAAHQILKIGTGEQLGPLRQAIEIDVLRKRHARGVDLEDPLPPGDAKRPGFSSGERQLRALQEIVSHTDAAVYLLDEWDANLDPNNRATADALVEELAHRARVVEISHRDRI